MSPPRSDPFVSALGPHERRVLLSGSTQRRLDRGDRLFIAGDRAARVYLLQTGVIKYVARDRQGRETILALALPDDIVGELPVLDDLPQPCDAVALTRCCLLSMDADHMMWALERSSPAALAFARTLARRTRWMCDAAFERRSTPVAGRLAGRLLDLADVIGQIEPDAIELKVPFIQEDLAGLSGMSRESACKTLSLFKKAGIVDYRQRRLRILRPDMLERIRCAGPGARSSR